MKHWEAAKTDDPSPETWIVKEDIENAWNKVGNDYWRQDCGMWPENPVEYYSNGDRWDSKLQDYDNCLSCLCDNCRWNTEENYCDSDSCQ